jgi:F420-non-reducing hydrogenase small subunit
MLKIATEMFGACSGCEIAILDLNEKILDVFGSCDLVYSPILMDTKKFPEKVDVVFISGCIRNEENRERAKEIRERANTVIALGSCACFGGIPGLANLFSTDEVLKEVYINTPSTVNDKGVVPSNVPKLEKRVYTLEEVIKVDINIPGCPPPTKLIENAISCILSGKKFELPKRSVCDECERKIENKLITSLRMPNDKPNPEKCLLEQGFLCLGPVTREGCGAICTKFNMGCEGCMGPTENVKEQGAKMLSALASILDIDVDKLKEEKDKFIADPIGSFYRFTLPASIIKQKVKNA